MNGARPKVECKKTDIVPRVGLQRSIKLCLFFLFFDIHSSSPSYFSSILSVDSEDLMSVGLDSVFMVRILGFGHKSLQNTALQLNTALQCNLKRLT